MAIQTDIWILLKNAIEMKSLEVEEIRLQQEAQFFVLGAQNKVVD
jgi:hypothetical protein